MRKRDLLTWKDGGLCAPSGFRVNAVCAGIDETCRLPKRTLATEDIALIATKGRFPVACVYAQGSLQGAPVIYNRKLLKGYARAIFVNSGVANACERDANKNTIRIRDEVAKRLIISRDEVVVASTGELCATFPMETVVNGLNLLVSGLDSTQEKSTAFARAITTSDTFIKELSYTYMQGDYPCTFGLACKGNARVAPNMATTLCFITTDVNISPEMLQRALSSAVNETFNLMVGDGISSLNDTVCLISSCMAGNYKISEPDTEYKKFYLALKAVCAEACNSILRERGRLFSCVVKGAKSQRVARTIARAVACSEQIKKDLCRYSISVSSLLCLIGGVEEQFSLDTMSITLLSKTGELVLAEEGKPFPCFAEHVQKVINGESLALCIDLKNGNYSAQSKSAL